MTDNELQAIEANYTTLMSINQRQVALRNGPSAPAPMSPDDAQTFMESLYQVMEYDMPTLIATVKRLRLLAHDLATMPDISEGRDGSAADCPWCGRVKDQSRDRKHIPHRIECPVMKARALMGAGEGEAQS